MILTVEIKGDRATQDKEYEKWNAIAVNQVTVIHETSTWALYEVVIPKHTEIKRFNLGG